MCVLEYILKKKHQVKDNQYIIDFLKHSCKYTTNNVDDKLIELVESLLIQKS